MFRAADSCHERQHGFPRIRGDVPFADFSPSTGLKFSPHTRGCSYLIDRWKAGVIVFPAYAGMFRGCNRNQSASGSFPRIRGDVPRGPDHRYYFFRFSPHTRGCSYLDVLGEMPAVVFPAYAGMFLGPSRLSSRHIRFPRIRGDVPIHPHRGRRVGEFSPHTRGCSESFDSVVQQNAVFPAYAGMFRSRRVKRSRRKSFPRIRGDVPIP